MSASVITWENSGQHIVLSLGISHLVSFLLVLDFLELWSKAVIFNRHGFRSWAVKRTKK